MRSLNIPPVLLVVFLVAAYAFVSESDYREAVAQERQNWMASQCMPEQPGDRAVLVMHQDGSTQCSLYENAGYGSAPVLKFAEVRE